MINPVNNKIGVKTHFTPIIKYKKIKFYEVPARTSKREVPARGIYYIDIKRYQD